MSGDANVLVYLGWMRPISEYSTMRWQQPGCRILLTEDFQDGRRLGQVTFVNPFDPTNADLLDRVLPGVEN